MKLCCTRPPMLYLCITLWMLTFINCIYIFIQVLIPQCITGYYPSRPGMSQPQIQVKLVETSEHTIFSRIRFPIRKNALLHGKVFSPTSSKKKFILGIPSMARPETEYLNTTLQNLLSSLSHSELKLIFIVVFLADKEKKVRIDRGKRIYGYLKKHVDSGLIQIIHSPDNIYPFLNYSNIRPTFQDTPGQIEWRSKICLDFSFLMSYCSELSGATYFMHLEDDVVPLKGFINATMDFIDSQNSSEWTSLQLSDYTSIGRLYKTSDLHKLVDFILIFYTKMPVDWLMAEYDRLQVPDNLEIHKINKSLFTHSGKVSSKELFLKKEAMEANKKYDKLKGENPSAVTLLTNMRQYQYFALNNSYFPSSLYFWCIPFHGGSIDIIFNEPQEISSVSIVSGLEKSDGRPEGSDAIKDAWLKVSPRMIELHPKSGIASCINYEDVSHITEPKVHISFDKEKTQKYQCIRLQLGEFQTPYESWLVIKLIRIVLVPSETNIN
ncbi:alpha-1,6-mannosyl-glycoprotein 4-beta-N-acetylglucosaminyltransferase [Lepeophtheirus salmonis]|uniref:alpha-1,6-mannosyl-glycoprotein 4-beta-N-acetylglucosaminyltransferase n=1 Tax=Lepeophtheirus salmonis TaxID=72036 RepID=UPI001AE15744|nr:alpha-1,6-mannosyl-glycoprotein 4-beta-N-acetylglucosaminyltransferase-like [Lepeophtheirus salmonis]